MATESQVQEALSRRYNCAGILRLSDGTFAFFESGYRLGEAGITAERAMELMVEYDHSRRLYAAQIAAAPVQRDPRQTNADDLLEGLGL